MEMMPSRWNQENYDTAADAYDAYIASEHSYNALAETPFMHQLLQTLSGTRLLDFCCGTGRYTNWLAEYHPHAEIVGVDFSEQSIQTAQRKAAEHHLRNVQFHVGSVETITERYDHDFDGIVWGMGLNYFSDLDVVLDGVQSCLTSKGWLVCSFVHPLIWAGDYLEDEDGTYGRSVYQYFNREMQTHQWKHVRRDDGQPFITRNYPYTFEALTTALSRNNLYLERLLEPQPIPEGARLAPDLYQRLTCCPQFAIIQAVKKT